MTTQRTRARRVRTDDLADQALRRSGASPIRRFADLVLQRQCAAHLGYVSPLPYTVEELLHVLAAGQDVEGEARDVESRATRFHVLEYISDRYATTEFDATVLRRQGARAMVEIDELCVRGNLTKAGGFEVGSRVRVRVDKVDASRDTLVFRAID